MASIDFREIDLIVMLTDEPGCPRLPAGIPVVRMPLPDPDAMPAPEADEAIAKLARWVKPKLGLT